MGEKVCAICGRSIGRWEKWTIVDGKYVHWECWEKAGRPGRIERADPPSLVHPRAVLEEPRLVVARRLAWEVYRAVEEGRWGDAKRLVDDLMKHLPDMEGLCDYLKDAIERGDRERAYSYLVRILYGLARTEEKHGSAEERRRYWATEEWLGVKPPMLRGGRR